ncbi:MAG: glycoside hydrolase family 3 N-terminal domain-containing protein [Bacteroidota bacterium]
MRLSSLLLIALLASLAAGCAPASEPTTDDGPPTIQPANWPVTSGGLAIDSDIEARIDALMAQMSVEEMVAQTIQADLTTVTPEDVRTYRLGSILNGGNSDPYGDIRAPAETWLALADSFYEASMDTTGGRLAIPLLWGTDAVHGHNNIVGATVFPHNIGLGAARNAELMEQIGAITAREVRVTGMDWTFAPTLAVVRDDRWGRTYEGYAEHPEVVAAYAPAVVRGLQGELGSDTFLQGEKLIATAKHFMGDGGTLGGVDQGDNLSSEADFRDIHGAGYPPAIEAGVQTVMASFSSWHGTKMHGYEALLNDVLKERMGFNGFVVGDWNGHGQVSDCTTTSCPAALNAGLDMYMAPDSWEELYENTLAQAQSGEIPRARLEDAVRRILRVKFRAGLFEAPRPSERLLGGDLSVLGAPEHLAVARQAVRESLVLLKNANGVLPLQPGQRVLVTGEAADDIGQQSGGWTLTWQGTNTTNADFPNGQSIWGGLQEAITAIGGTAVLSADGSYAQTPDVAVVVFGEEPYAEFIGDREDVDYPLDDGLTLLRTYREAGIPTVAVFLSGRALWMNPELNASEAFVAAFLPGSQGAGVADVLVAGPDGAPRHDFTGTLSYSWPRTAVQTPLNRDDPAYDPLFAYGFGLTYADDGSLAVLSEESGLEAESGGEGVFFAAGETGTRTLETRGEGVTITAVDRDAQEDSRQFTWSGTNPASVVITGEATDYAREANGELGLGIQYRLDALPEGTVTLFVEDAAGTRGTLDLTALLDGAETGTWGTVAFMLRCFPDVDPASLTTVFGLEADAPFTVSISDVRLVPNEGQVLCPTS